MASAQEIIDTIQLINSENIGPITFFKLLEMFKTPTEALRYLQTAKKPSVCPRNKAELEYQRAQKQKISIILYNDDTYPPNLKHLEDRPPVLYAKGNLSCLLNPLSLSIVGARNATINGRKTASKIAYDLTNNNVMVISGMARGIDAAAHKGALYATNQKGTTIAVLGTGVDMVYPKENTLLYNQIVEQGLILSEFPLGTGPQSSNFPRRNRIVASLSLGTLVVEANTNSGSLITARLALEYGKDIFAIPGSPDESRSAGPNKLIKEGAFLCENAEDILSVLCANNSRQIHRQIEFNLQPNEQISFTEITPPPQNNGKIIDYLNYDGVYVDEIIRTSGLDASTVAMELLELELEGRIIRQVGNKVALIK